LFLTGCQFHFNASPSAGAACPQQAADAIAVPPMPVKWTDLISDENMAGKFNRQDARAQSFLKESDRFLRAVGG
jgi:hypothetical protein